MIYAHATVPICKCNARIPKLLLQRNQLQRNLHACQQHTLQVQTYQSLVHMQLGQCSNAMRTSPNSFASDFNAICNYADFQAGATNPVRPMFLVNNELG